MRTHHKKYSVLFIIFGVLMLFIGVGLLFPASTANAQCGSQASSCKNCHEVQGEMPVNNDGTTWHAPHAFGDFCEFCHAGNVQSTVKAEAHTGMVDPLSDPAASCSACHDDYMDLAGEYAALLGVSLGEGSTPAAEDTAAPAAEASSAPAAEVASVSPIGNAPIELDEEDLVDFNKNYDEAVLGIRDLNVGNLILGVLSMVLLGGGLLFVSVNEGWLHISTEAVPETVEGFDKDVVGLLPKMEKLDKPGRKALKKLLKKPKKAAKVFTALADLDDKE